jgi:Asp-tRNA(Asn)/Glu-tRNA(Gln) amidotransferase A subunit family amidase
VPAGFSRAGLPVGLQLVTRPFGERALLEVAHALEERSGLAERIPPLAS